MQNTSQPPQRPQQSLMQPRQPYIQQLLPSQQQSKPEQPSPPHQPDKRKPARLLVKRLAGIGSLLGAIAAIVAILQFIGIPSPESLFPSASAIPNLKQFYNGTSDCIGPNCNPQSRMVLHIESQDQGNLKATASNTRITTISWDCTGTITANKVIILQCVRSTEFYQFRGILYSDGHIDGTETFPSGRSYRDILN